MVKRILILILILLFVPHASYGSPGVQKSHKLIVFYSPGCHNCIRIEKEITPADRLRLSKSNIEMEYRNIDSVENYKLLLSLEKTYQSKIRNVLPVFYFEEHFLNGSGNVKEGLEKLLRSSPMATTNNKRTPIKIDLVKRFKSFTIPAIIAVGLIDGINPCAVTAIIFFMSFLSFQRYRKQEIAVIGLTFIFSVYLTYCLIGLGIFEFLYRLQGFWLVAKTVNIIIGITSIIFSLYALHDFIHYRKTKSTDGFLLSLPPLIKNNIHKIIGSHYRLHDNGKRIFKRALWKLAVSALVAGFLVSVLEAVCVAKIYLPTIVFVLKTTSLKLKALAYLLLYNLLFIIPPLVILAFALAGTASERFQRVLKGHL